MINGRLIIIILLSFYNLSSQTVLEPPKEIILDPELKELLANLRDAVKNKDKDFIISKLHPNITIGYDTDSGIKAFKKQWNWKDPKLFWSAFGSVLDLGGGGFYGGDYYEMPFVLSNWPECYINETVALIAGYNVNVRERPSTESPIIKKLSYTIVKYNWTNDDWYEIKSTSEHFSGSLGYVHRNYIAFPNDWSIDFVKVNNLWRIQRFSGLD